MSLFDWILVASTIAVFIWFGKLSLSKDRDKERHEEDDAREFFDQHGHWPDETPAEAAARAERAAQSERLARALQD